jgi:hypothetical protein
MTSVWSLNDWRRSLVRVSNDYPLPFYFHDKHMCLGLSYRGIRDSGSCTMFLNAHVPVRKSFLLTLLMSQRLTWKMGVLFKRKIYIWFLYFIHWYMYHIENYVFEPSNTHGLD